MNNLDTLKTELETLLESFDDKSYDSDTLYSLIDAIQDTYSEKLSYIEELEIQSFNNTTTIKILEIALYILAKKYKTDDYERLESFICGTILEDWQGTYNMQNYDKNEVTNVLKMCTNV